MLGHFPTPYPDELLYSVCARFATRAGYFKAKSVLEDLFGTPTTTAVIDLPNRLGYLAEVLPANSSLTADRLIEQYTLLPFFTSFQPPIRAKQLRDDLKGHCGPASHMRSGIMASRIPMPSHLRFCPICKRADEKYFGETYWHRLHQLPGVEVCPLHQTLLENSDVSLQAGRNNLLFISADQATHEVPVRRIDLTVQDHKLLLQIARDASRLLDQSHLGTSLKSLRNRYLKLLIKRGLATYTGSIHVDKLLNEFRSFCSPSLLKSLDCEFTGSDQVKSNWLLRLVRLSKHAQHPLYHLLLIQFLGCTVEEFFRLPDELSFFGEGPWPCLNPAADHCQQLVVQECQLGDRLRYGKPTGRFRCACGFTYVRTGPDLSMEDRFRIGRVISFGAIWENKLQGLWQESALSLSEIGRQLGVDPLTVRRHAARLKLPHSSHGSKTSKPLKRAMRLKSESISMAWQKKRQAYRSMWLSAIRQDPKIILKAQRHKLPREYIWLLENDSEWLKSHRPQPQKRNPSTLSVDWKRRDAEYAVAVKSAASRLKDAPGRPVQVTKTAIGRAVGAITGSDETSIGAV